MLDKIINNIKYPIKKIYWRIKNKENLTFMTRNFGLQYVKVGRGTYGPLSIYSFGSSNEKLEIGNYCCIGPKTTFVLGGEHDYKNISSYPFQKVILKTGSSNTKGPIIVEDDVWFGYGCTILSGVKIGRGAVIGAGSVVSKDIPPYAIYANGKIIKYRFSEKIIDKLMQIDYSKLNKEKILKNISQLSENITEENIDKIIEHLKEDLSYSD